jgi:DNA-binding transcriptional MerR regulator
MTNFVFYVNPEQAIMCLPAGARALYSLDTAARLTGVHPEKLRHYCALGLFGPEWAGAESGPTFDDNTLYEVRRIEHGRQHHGLSLRALPLVCELWREVDRLETEVRVLRSP